MNELLHPYLQWSAKSTMHAVGCLWEITAIQGDIEALERERSLRWKSSFILVLSRWIRFQGTQFVAILNDKRRHQIIIAHKLVNKFGLNIRTIALRPILCITMEFANLIPAQWLTCCMHFHVSDSVLANTLSDPKSLFLRLTPLGTHVLRKAVTKHEISSLHQSILLNGVSVVLVFSILVRNRNVIQRQLINPESNNPCV